MNFKMNFKEMMVMMNDNIIYILIATLVLIILAIVLDDPEDWRNE